MKKKLILFVFLLGSLLASIGQAQAQCTDCDFEVASTGGSNTLTLAANSVTCITNDVIFSDISWANGATLCIAPGKTLTIQNNMHNNESTFNLNLEVYGTLAMGNPEFNFNMTMNIHPGGVFKTTGNAAFKGEDVTINNNQGNFQVSVLSLNGNSGKINILNSEGAYFYVKENLNVGNNVKLVYNNKGFLEIGGQFGISPSSSFSNCGDIITAGFNLMGGKIYNSGGKFLITSHLDGSGEVHNYATIEIEKIQGNSKNIYNYGVIEVSTSSIVDMAIYGPTEANSYGEFRWEGQASGVNNFEVTGNQIFVNTNGDSSLEGMFQNTGALKPQTDSNIVWGECADCIVGQDNPACIDGETGEPEEPEEPENSISAKDDINQTPQGVAVDGNVLDNYKGEGLTVKDITVNGSGNTPVTIPVPETGTTGLIDIYDEDGVTIIGTIEIDKDGKYTFKPEEGYTGKVPVEYTAKDKKGFTDDATLTIKVIPVVDPSKNNPPVAIDDNVVTKKDTPVSGNLLSNDSDPDGDEITVTKIWVPKQDGGTEEVEITSSGTTVAKDVYNEEGTVKIGEITVDKDGNFTFDPVDGYAGEVPPIGYEISDNRDPDALTDKANLNIIVVQDVIGEIIANDDANSAPIGIEMTGSVKANDNWGSEDKNPKITEASVTINDVTTNLTLGASTSIPGAGEITLYTDGSYTYTSDVIGTIPVVYTVKNDDGDEAKATLYLTALNDCMDLVLFFEDFGVSDKDDGNFGRKTSPYMPSGSFAFGTPYPQSAIYDEYEINNNHYAVVAPGYIKLGVDPNQYYFWTPAYNETGTVTDRSGTEDGAVMVINAGSTLDAFYQRKISVVSGESYRASFWLYLVNGPSRVSIDIMNPATKEVLAVMTSPEMDTTYKGKWTKFELYFKIPANLECEIDELLLSFRNNKSEHFGNDYYVDNIKLEQVCEVPDGTPTVDVNCPTYTVSIKAIDDFYEVGNNSSVDGNILDNDYGDDGDVLTVTEVVVDGQTIPIVVGGTEFTTKEGGKAKVYPDGTIEYTPPAGNNGFIDIFDYQVCNQVDFCATAEVHIAVGVCAIGQVVNDFGWSGGDNIVTKTITQPATDYGYTFDIYELDNSFNMLINGTLLAQQEIEFQSSAGATQNIRFADGTKWEADGIPGVWDIKGDKAKNMPVIRVNIFYTGKVTMYASKVSADDPNYKLEVLELYNGNKFNNITYYIAGNDENEITVTQSVIGATVMDGRGYGRHRIENCPNYWHGTTDSDWSKRENWTDNLVPNNLEDVEFATAANNSYITDVGSSGAGNAQGEALRDLHLDTDRKIKDLINDSDMDLWVTTENKLEIHGEVKDNNPDAGTIVVKADEDEATGTLIFSKPELNTEVEAKVEFINLADECADCGFYKRNWQYFGIPVDGGAFPFNNPLLDGEMVRRWDEPTNGDKWLPVATESMIPFRGYEITSKVTAPKYEFEGTLNVGDKNIVLSKTPGVNYSGMNLLANSYTAAIPIELAAIELGSSLAENTVYLFNRGTRDQWRKTNGGTVTGIAGGQYTAVPINLAGQATLPDRILSMHSFMVNAASDEAQISLKYDQLVKNETGINQPAWRSTDNNGKRQLPYIVLDVIGEGSADRVWLFEESSTTRGYDNGWDGHKMLEGDLIQVFATDADQNKYQVTTVPQLDNITLGIAARENESYTISVSTAADVENRRLYLHDTFTGRGYLLKNGAEFVIPGTRSANQNRFKITASNLPTAMTEASTINTYVRDNVIVVENRSGENATVSVYDISGRFVGKAQIAKDEMKSFPELSIAAGVKVVKVVTDSGSVNRSDRVLLK